MYRDRIREVERVLQESMMSKTSLRKEMAILSRDCQEDVQGVVETYEQKLNTMQEQVDQSVKAKEIEFARRMEVMRREIAKKDSVLLKLEMEFSEKMQSSWNTNIERWLIL